MKNNVTGLFLVASCFMFIVGGCAANEMVKKEEPVSPTTKAATQVTVEPVKTKLSSDQPVKPAPSMQNAVNSSAPAQNADKHNAALEKIYFDFDSYDLSSEARKTLQKDMQLFKNDSTDDMRIEGNCDERGSAEYNIALGEKRAMAAMQYLVTLGVSPDRLSVISYGKERPAVQGQDESAWSKNRRDEFVIHKQ